MMSSDGLSSFPYPIITNPNPNSSSNSAKRKRNLAGNPDPDAEVIALSPQSLMATNRFMCEICNKGFQREQNLQLHRRGHNLPWKLKQRNKNEVVRKKVYICPEKSCVHHDASRALGDLTGVKKHFSRKHGEKKWKCDKCLKKYAVQSDWKAHGKICGTREYKCDCGTLFSRKDSFITHRAFCDALSNENSRMASFPVIQATTNLNFHNNLMSMNGGGQLMSQRFPGMLVGGFGLQKGPVGNELIKPRLPSWLHNHENNPPEITATTNSSFMGLSSLNNNNGGILSSEMMQWLSRSNETVGDLTELPQGLCLKVEEDNINNKGEIVHLNSLYNSFNADCHNAPPPPPHTSATALLQKASQIGSTRSTNSSGFGVMSTSDLSGLSSLNQSENNLSGGMMMMNNQVGLLNLTRDFLGVEGNERRVISLQQELINFTSSMNDSSIGFSESQ